MSVVVEDICNFLVVSLPVFGISVKVFKIYAGCKKKKGLYVVIFYGLGQSIRNII